MASSYVSAGTYIRERDFSDYVASASTTVVGMVSTAVRGPVNKPTLITSAEAFLRIFGSPNVNHYGPYAALNYLRQGNQLWYNRVARVYAKDAASIISLASPTDGKVYGIVVAAGHTLNVNDYARITQTGKRTSQNLKITAIAPSGNNYAITFESPLLDTYSASGSSDSTVDASPGGAGAGHAEVFAYGRRGGEVFPLVKFTARDPGDWANFGSSKGIEIRISDGGAFANLDPVSGLPETSSDGVALQGLLPSAPSVDTRIDLLKMITAGTARVGETRGVNFDTLASIVSTATSVGANLGLVIPVSTQYEIGDTVVVSGGTAYDGTYTIDSVTNTTTTTTLGVTGWGGALPGVKATGTLTSNNTNVSDGDTVTIASTVYRFKNTMAQAYDVKIGADADASLLNLIKAINASGTAGTHYYTGTLVHPSVSAASAVTSHAFAVTALTGGTAGNSIATTDTATTLSWGAATLAGGTAPVSITGYVEDTTNTDVHKFGTVYRCVSGVGGNSWVAQGVLTKKVEVLFNGVVVESFNNLIGYDAGSPNYWDTVVGTESNPVSAYVYAEYVGTGGEQPISSYDRIKFPNNPRVVMGLDSQVRTSDSGTAPFSTFTNTKGYNGDAPTAADYIGTVAENGDRTGLQLFLNVEAYDINILAVPGISLASVCQEIIAVCEERNDCLGLIDPPLGLSPQDVVDWHNGSGPYTGLHSAFVSNKAALYYTWVKVYDPYTRRELFMPPSAIMPAVFAYSDSVGEPWYAPAGLTRGRVERAIKAERVLTQGDRDYMYGPGNGNAVNPIATFAHDGILVYGQRTLQRHPSALDRVNVRRLLFFIEKQIARTVRVLEFEQDDPILWDQFKNLVEPFLAGLVARRALENYAVACDINTNTPDRRNNNELWAKVTVVPVKSAEKIVIDMNIFASGISLTEFVSQIDNGTLF